LPWFDTSVFNIPLLKLLQRETTTPGVPLFLEKITATLETTLQLEGLFRLSAGASELQELLNLFDKGGWEKAELSKYNPHGLAYLIKHFFRNLPEPIFPFDLYDPFVDLARDIPEREERLVKIKEMMKKVPEAYMPLMKFIFKFIKKVADKVPLF
jgi:hypothetical protein